MSKDLCIVIMYELLNRMAKMSKEEIIKFVTPAFAGGQDQYAGLSSFQRVFEVIICQRFEEEIRDADKRVHEKLC